jgi:cyclophilin family peptidyl-prolyl cis-trans isomerase
MRRTITLAALLAVLAAACGGEDDAGVEDSPAVAGDTTLDAVTNPEYLAFRDQPTACGAERPDLAVSMEFSAPEDAGVTGAVTAVLHTSCGPITVELDPALAPETVNSFVFLAEQGYFDGTVSHRVVPGFVIQAGDPTASGRSGPGYAVPDEFPQAGFAYTRGVLAMANSGQPNSGGSQFFIVLDDIFLPPTFTVFGSVVEGFEVMDAITGLSLGPQPIDSVPSRPLETIHLERVEIDR